MPHTPHRSISGLLFIQLDSGPPEQVLSAAQEHGYAVRAVICWFMDLYILWNYLQRILNGNSWTASYRHGNGIVTRGQGCGRKRAGWCTWIFLNSCLARSDLSVCEDLLLWGHKCKWCATFVVVEWSWKGTQTMSPSCSQLHCWTTQLPSHSGIPLPYEDAPDPLATVQLLFLAKFSHSVFFLPQVSFT